MRKILVIRGGALGDFILTLPVLAALRRHFTEASVELLADTRYASLAIAGGLAQHASALDSASLSGLFAIGGSRNLATANYFAKFDLIISYVFDPSRIFEIKHRPMQFREIHRRTSPPRGFRQNPRNRNPPGPLGGTRHPRRRFDTAIKSAGIVALASEGRSVACVASRERQR